MDPRPGTVQVDWMRDRACQTVTRNWPHSVPRREARTAEHRREPTTCARQVSGEVPKRQKGPPRNHAKRAPRKARRIPAERRSQEAAHRVRRRPPPSSESAAACGPQHPERDWANTCRFGGVDGQSDGCGVLYPGSARTAVEDMAGRDGRHGRQAAVRF